MSNTFGEFIKKVRVASEVTLREFCEAHGFDPGNYSRMERGLFPPPQREDLLEKYALALGLKKGSDGWYEFFDLAATTRGQLPKDLLSDEELVEKLPVLFRTLRGSKVPADKLDDLIKKAREG